MGRLEYLSVRNITDQNAELYFYGEIVGDEWEKWNDTDTCPQDVIDLLKQIEGKAVDIYINSPGGSVFAGLAIYNMLCRKKERKVCHIDGVAGSIASVIAMAGDEIIMPENSFLMIHNPMAFVSGNSSDMRKMADDLDIIREGMEAVYKSKLKNPEDVDTIRQLMDAETWLKARDAETYFNVTVAEANKAKAKAPDTEKMKMELELLCI